MLRTAGERLENQATLILLSGSFFQESHAWCYTVLCIWVGLFPSSVLPRSTACTYTCQPNSFKDGKDQHFSFSVPCNNEKLQGKTEQCIEGTLLPPFPYGSGVWSWGLPPTHLIKVLPAFEIAFFIFVFWWFFFFSIFFFYFISHEVGWSSALFLPFFGAWLFIFFCSERCVSHTLIYSLSQESQETLMKEQAARVINTYQTFNCTISEQYVPLCVREHWQLEMHRQRWWYPLVQPWAPR